MNWGFVGTLFTLQVIVRAGEREIFAKSTTRRKRSELTRQCKPTKRILLEREAELSILLRPTFVSKFDLIPCKPFPANKEITIRSIYTVDPVTSRWPMLSCYELANQTDTLVL